MPHTRTNSCSRNVVSIVPIPRLAKSQGDCVFDRERGLFQAPSAYAACQTVGRCSNRVQSTRACMPTCLGIWTSMDMPKLSHRSHALRPMFQAQFLSYIPAQRCNAYTVGCEGGLSERQAVLNRQPCCTLRGGLVQPSCLAAQALKP